MCPPPLPSFRNTLPSPTKSAKDSMFPPPETRDLSGNDLYHGRFAPESVSSPQNSADQICQPLQPPRRGFGADRWIDGSIALGSFSSRSASSPVASMAFRRLASPSIGSHWQRLGDLRHRSEKGKTRVCLCLFPRHFHRSFPRDQKN